MSAISSASDLPVRVLPGQGVNRVTITTAEDSYAPGSVDPQPNQPHIILNITVQPTPAAPAPAPAPAGPVPFFSKRDCASVALMATGVCLVGGAVTIATLTMTGILVPVSYAVASMNGANAMAAAGFGFIVAGYNRAQAVNALNG